MRLQGVGGLACLENRKPRMAQSESNTHSCGEVMFIGIAIVFFIGFLAVLAYALCLTGVFDR